MYGQLDALGLLTVAAVLVLVGLGIGLLTQAILNERQLAERDRAFDELRHRYASGDIGD